MGKTNKEYYMLKRVKEDENGKKYNVVVELRLLGEAIRILVKNGKHDFVIYRCNQKGDYIMKDPIKPVRLIPDEPTDNEEFTAASEPTDN